MRITIKPSQVNGTLNAPASKSMMQRAVAAALLAEGLTVIHNPSFCADALAAMDMAEKLGAIIVKDQSDVSINGGLNPKEYILNCGEAGLSIRMFSPIVALHARKIIIIGEGSLLNRPIQMIEDALKQLGVAITTNQGLLPIEITGPLHGGMIRIDGSISSQLLTGLLMALPLTKKNSKISVNDLKSKPYIDMTLDVLAQFGIEVINDKYTHFYIKGNQSYKSGNYTIEGDWSGAAFLLVAAAIGGTIRVENLQSYSHQSDKRILEVLKVVGANIQIEQNAITVSKNNLIAFDFDATDCPDLFPPLVALAIYCKGTSRIKGALRLVHKESNRGIVLQHEFAKLGIRINIAGDDMFIEGGEVNGGIIDSHNDHRIAMATAIVALGSIGPIVIEGAECVAKSYLHFFENLSVVGVGVDIE